MSLRHLAPLLIGDLTAVVVVNDDGEMYISLGVTGENEERFGIDEIEATALLDWLDKVIWHSVRNTGVDGK